MKLSVKPSVKSGQSLEFRSNRRECSKWSGEPLHYMSRGRSVLLSLNVALVAFLLSPFASAHSVDEAQFLAHQVNGAAAMGEIRQESFYEERDYSYRVLVVDRRQTCDGAIFRFDVEAVSSGATFERGPIDIQTRDGRSPGVELPQQARALAKILDGHLLRVRSLAPDVAQRRLAYELLRLCRR